MKQNIVKQLSRFLEARLPRGRRASKWTLFLLFLLVVGGGLVYWQIAQGVNRTWDGGGVDGTCGGAGTTNNRSCAADISLADMSAKPVKFRDFT